MAKKKSIMMEPAMKSNKGKGKGKGKKSGFSQMIGKKKSIAQY